MVTWYKQADTLCLQLSIMTWMSNIKDVPMVMVLLLVLKVWDLAHCLVSNREGLGTSL